MEIDRNIMGVTIAIDGAEMPHEGCRKPRQSILIAALPQVVRDRRDKADAERQHHERKTDKQPLHSVLVQLIFANSMLALIDSTT